MPAGTDGNASMIARSAIVPAVSALLLGLTAPVAAADRGAIQRACFSPTALAALEGERLPVKGAIGSRIGVPKVQLSGLTPVPPQLRGAIRRVDLPKGSPKLVALTLDLCEQPGEVAGYDGPIFDYLRATATKATLFAGGKWMISHDGRAQQLMLDPLFEIGVHGWAHRNVRKLSGAALVDEMVDPLKAFSQVSSELATARCVGGQGAAIPAAVTLHRFPFGACSPEALATAADHGLMSIQWDVSTGDPTPSQSATAIAETMIRHTRPGSIIIAHANGRGHHTAAALPLAIPKLKAMGYVFVTVSELIAAGRPVIADTCYDNRPGDTDKYDFLFSKRPPPSAASAVTTGDQGLARPANHPPIAVPR